MPSKQGDRLCVRLSNLSHPKCALADIILAHPFVHQLQVILPVTTDQQSVTTARNAVNSTDVNRQNTVIKQALSSLQESFRGFWTVERAHISTLLQQGLDNGLIGRQKEWALQALAAGGNTDADQALALTADAKLHLIVNSEAYQRIGTRGKKCRLHTDRYECEFDLCTKGFSAGKEWRSKVLSALDCLLQPGLLLCTLAPGNLLGRSADTMAKTTVETTGRAAAAGAGGNTAKCSAAAATGQRPAAASAVGNFPAVSGDVPVAVLAPTAAGSEGISGRDVPEPMAVDHPDEQQSLHMPESQPLHHSTAGASGSSSVLQQSVGTDSRDASIGNIAADGASSALPTVASPSNVSASVNSMCTTIGTATSSAAWRSQADALQSTWPHARHHALQYSCSTSAGVRVPPQLTRSSLGSPPAAACSDDEASGQQALLRQLHEWLGALMCGCDASVSDSLLPPALTSAPTGPTNTASSSFTRPPSLASAPTALTAPTTASVVNTTVSSSRWSPAIVPDSAPVSRADMQQHTWQGAMAAWQVLLAVQQVQELVSGTGAAISAATDPRVSDSQAPHALTALQQQYSEHAGQEPPVQAHGVQFAVQPVVPWALVTAWGIADSPISHAGMEHGAAPGCSTMDSQLSVLLLPGGEYVLFRPLPAGEG